MSLAIKKTYPQLTAKTRKAWRSWLAKHHDSAEGVWLVSFKLSSGIASVNYSDSVEEAICYGWIDSVKTKLDEASYQQLFTPRKAGSGWSRVNKLRIEKLQAQGLLAAPGLARIEAAKLDGSWGKLDAIELLEVPADLKKSLAKNKTAQAYFDAFPRSTKRAILEWISNAVKPETRAKRVQETAWLAADNIRANQPRQVKR
jgi:uncharacterized protein YdeI (YjbR/CyaY-like superfamily)